MFVVHNFFDALAMVISFALTLYMYILIGRVIISWVNADPYNPIVRFLYEATEPLLGRIRRALPINFGGLDFSPVILIMGIIFLQRFLVPTLRSIGV